MSPMRVNQFVDEGLGHSSYVIDLGDGTAAVVDPPRFPTAHVDLIKSRGLRLAWTLDTHSHADYITGSPALAARSGAVFIAPAASRLESPHLAVADGDRITMAEGVELVALATPGHTPDHHAYLLVVNKLPVALFTGGSLMVGTVGRTDLCGPDLAIPLAHEMFAGLRRFSSLPGDVAVYPTHGAGSFCAAPGAAQRSSTLAHERATNPLFGIVDETEFVAKLVDGFGNFPKHFSVLPEVNRRGPVRYDALPQLAELTPDEVDRLVASGGAIIDARSAAAFAAGHVPGSLSITLRPVFGTWLAWLVQPNRRLVFLLDDDQDRDDLVRQCLDVGLENLAGVCAGGIREWKRSGRPVGRLSQVDATNLYGQIIDVRQANEFAEGHVPGAVNIELAAISEATLETGLVTVMCGHGERAMTAASILNSRQLVNVVVLDGGPDTWSAATGHALATT